MTAFKDCTTEDKWVKLKHHLSLGHPVPNPWVLWTLETIGQERISELEAALKFYAVHHQNPNEGPWGQASTDFGSVAREALKGETV
jgi:hypothetical protein